MGIIKNREMRKKQIVDLLDKKGEMATSKIALLIGVHHYSIGQYLEILKAEGKIKNKFKSGKTSKGVYWKIVE